MRWTVRRAEAEAGEVRKEGSAHRGVKGGIRARATHGGDAGIAEMSYIAEGRLGDRG